MEPMTLGSPSGSPATNGYLPSFLMGEPSTPTPRNNTLSPNKHQSGGRSLSFATSPNPTSPQDYNRSALGQKTLFGGYQQTPPSAAPNSQMRELQMQQNHSGVSGPPTQGLFDSLRNERNQVQTPTRGAAAPGMSQSQFGTPNMQQQQQQNMSNSAYGMNQNYLQQQPHQSHMINSIHQQQNAASAYNDSYLSSNTTNASFNASRASAMLSPLGGPSTPLYNNNNAPRYNDFWVTVFGFPTSATSTILQHFSQCGTIVEKVFPSQNGNWVHIKFASRLECDKALNYNEKILANNIMIGVTQCKDKQIVDKENQGEANCQTPKVRPLAQTAYRCVQNESAVIASPNAPQKSTGIMNKAMDLFFGW